MTHGFVFLARKSTDLFANVAFTSANLDERKQTRATRECVECEISFSSIDETQFSAQK